MSGLDELFAKAAPKAGIEGTWFTAQWRPDIATNEVLNLGVGFLSKDNELTLKLLNDFSRLECFFDSKNAAFHAELACQIIDERLRSKPCQRGDIFTGISIQERGFAQGADSESIVSKLYSEVVTMGRPRASKAKRKPFAPISRDAAYESLKIRLKATLKMDFERHVPQNPYKQIKDEFGTERIYLPFQREKGVASLTSAAYADPWRVKTQLYEGFRSVETALKKDFGSHAALFIVMPGNGLPQDAFDSLSGQFDEFYSFVRRHNIQIESSDSIKSLSTSVSEWCLDAA